MKKICKIFLAFGVSITLSVVAHAQVPGQIPSGYMWGNSTPSRTTAKPTSPTALIDRAVCGTRGAVLTRQSAGWLCLTPGTSGLPLISNGAGADVGYAILSLTAGGTNANLTASNGGIFYSTASAGAILSGTATAGQHLQSGSSAAPSWTTNTFPSTAAAGTILNAQSANTVIATATPILGTAGTTGTLRFVGSSSGTVTVTPQATAGSPTITWPNTTGTVATNVSGPILLNAVTGNISCTTCATTTNGGALSATTPVSLSAGGQISIVGAAGQVLAGSPAAFTANPTLGASGTAGSVTMGNATSGTLQLQPATGALGSSVVSVPAGTHTLTSNDLTGQVLTGGAVVTQRNITPGNFTVDCGQRPIQSVTNIGAYTITAPASDSYCMIFVNNSATASATTFSGFSVGTNTGDPLTTTNGNKFIISIIRISGTSTYQIKALQ